MVDAAELQDRAYRSIRQKIVEGRVRSRKDLSRRMLQAELGVSSTCIQVALARLEGERLLESRPQSGTFLRQINFQEYCDHYELRERLEPHAASRAATRITPAQLKLLHQSCKDYAALEEHWNGDVARVSDEFLDRAVAAENLFHGTIMEASGNGTAAHIVENLRVVGYNRLMTASLPPAIVLDLLKRTVQEHRGIYAALKKGDAPNAMRRMLRHIRRGRRYVMNFQQFF
jgi:DNA-binding GntR family transcriptional regulator